MLVINCQTKDFEKHLNQHDVIYLDMTEFADNKDNENMYLENLDTDVVGSLTVFL